MRLIVSDRAVADLNNIHAWISRDKPRFAKVVIDGLTRRIERLAAPGMAFTGRQGAEPGTRELVIPPYIVVYDVDNEAREIRIRAVFHARQDR